MARISINNGLSTVDVSTLTDSQVSTYLRQFAHGQRDISEAVHGLTDDEREYLSLCCERYEAAHGQAWTVG